MKKGSKMRSGPGPGERARRWMMKHPEDSVRQVSEAAGVSVRIVYYQRKKMVLEGQVPADHFSLTSYAKPLLAPKAGGSDSPTSEGHKTLGFKDANLSTEESLKMLTTLARDGYEAGNFAQAKGSIETHEKLQNRSAVSTLGPPDPQTDKEKIDRLAVIIDVCGPILAASAILKAFWGSTERNLFFGEATRQQATRVPDINPWAQTAVSSPPITPEEVMDDSSHEDQKGPPVATYDEKGPPDSGSSDPLD